MVLAGYSGLRQHLLQVSHPFKINWQIVKIAKIPNSKVSATVGRKLECFLSRPFYGVLRLIV